MELCVGAVSRLVVEEAAALGMVIVASRRQVDVGGGYTGWDAAGIAAVIHAYPDAKIVRDHGGPNQGGKHDNGVASFDADVDAGFDRIHIDVCQAGNDVDILSYLVRRYAGMIELEVGDEHAQQSTNNLLIETAVRVAKGSDTPMWGVISTGNYVWADRQIGTPVPPAELRFAANKYRNAFGVKTKAHNADWQGNRLNDLYTSTLDEYNLAPEIGAVEIDALLTVLPGETSADLLDYAYDDGAWQRWFATSEGTWLQRAKCSLRYLRNDDRVKYLLDEVYDAEVDAFVRKQVRDALNAG